MFKLMGKKIITILRQLNSLIWFYLQMQGKVHIIWASLQETCLQGFQLSEIQASLLSYRDQLEN